MRLSVHQSTLTALALSLCVNSTGAQTPEASTDFILPMPLQDYLKSHVPNQPQPDHLSSVKALESIDHKGNFGRKAEVDVGLNLTRLESGLTGTESSTTWRDGKGGGRGYGVSLCGLIPLLSESQSTTNIATTTALPVGKVFIPFGIKSSIDFSNRLRVIALETNAPSLCNPSPGLEFILKFETDLVIKTSGLFSRTNNVKRIQDFKCSVAAEAKQATTVAVDLSGDYFDVRCEIFSADGKTRKARYAYLLSSRYYLQIEEINEWQSATITYPVVTYSK